MSIEPRQLLLQALVPAAINRHIVPTRAVAASPPAAWLAKLQSRFALPDANHPIRPLASTQQTGTHFESCFRQPRLTDRPQIVSQRKRRWTTLVALLQPRARAQCLEHSVSEPLTANCCGHNDSRPNRNGSHGHSPARSSHHHYDPRKDHRSSTVDMNRDSRRRLAHSHTNIDNPNTAQIRKQYSVPTPTRDSPILPSRSRCEILLGTRRDLHEIL